MTTHTIHNSERWRVLLEQVVAVTPTIRRALESARELNMRQYVQQLADFPEQVPLSDPRDVNRAAETQLMPVLGAQAAKKAAECFPGAALTANHLAAFRPPAGCLRLYLAADADAAGRHGIEGLSRRAQALGILPLVLNPELGDFNEDLRRLGPDRLLANLRDQLAPEDAHTLLSV